MSKLLKGLLAYMEQKIKEIVGDFIKLSADQIGPATRIDRSAVKSSILLHRMYARLAEAGLVVANYSAVRVFGDLSGPSVGGVMENGERGPEPEVNGAPGPGPGGEPGPRPGVWRGGESGGRGDLTPGVGVDMEEVSALPRTPDFRKDDFYKMNFTPEEIAYCILQPDPYASFAGLFAAKEAIIKAGVVDRTRSFHLIEIDHSPEGKPQYPDHSISISHAGGMAVAVAVAGAASSNIPAAVTHLKDDRAVKTGTVSWISWLALLLSVLAVVLVLLH